MLIQLGRRRHQTLCEDSFILYIGDIPTNFVFNGSFAKKAFDINMPAKVLEFLVLGTYYM